MADVFLTTVSMVAGAPRHGIPLAATAVAPATLEPPVIPVSTNNMHLSITSWQTACVSKTGWTGAEVKVTRKHEMTVLVYIGPDVNKLS